MNFKLVKKESTDTVIKFVFDNSKIKDFEAKSGQVCVRYEKKETIVYAGLGDRKKIDLDSLRASSANAIRCVVGLKRSKVSFIDPLFKLKNSSVAILEGAILGSYVFDKYKSDKKSDLKNVEFVSNMNKLQFDTVKKLSESVFLTRDLVNDNASVVTPQKLEDIAKDISKSSLVNIKVLNQAQIKKQGLGLLNAVGQASSVPPRLILMNYVGNSKSKTSSCVVGKGITFDTGGLNLKPSGFIEKMRCDMSGAASVLGLMRALTLLKPKINVLGVVAAAHSAIDADSFFCGDTYKSYSGKTVEINNTDAEGRLILADALSYSIKNYKVDKVIDLATLTGAVVVALGDVYAGLFSNDDGLSNKLIKSGSLVGEKLWRMPVDDVHSESMKGDIADLSNISSMGRNASSSTAASFLKEFVGDKPWAHIDIAGTAFNENSIRGEIPKNATGYGVRLLYEFLTSQK